MNSEKKKERLESKDSEEYPVTIDPAKSMDSPREKPVSESMRDFWGILRYALRFWRLLIAVGLLGLVGAALAPTAAFFFAASVDTFLGIISPGSSLSEQSAESGGFSIGSIAQFFIERIGDFVGGDQTMLLSSSCWVSLGQACSTRGRSS